MFFAISAVPFYVSAQQFGSNEYVSVGDISLFSSGNLVDGCLLLNATASYDSLSAEQKSGTVKIMMDETGAKRAVVISDYGSVLWYRNNRGLQSLPISSPVYDVNDYTYLELDRLGCRKWFLTFGGQLGFGSDVSSLGVNARAGTYLFQNLFDMGLGLNVNGTFPSDSDLDESASLSLDLSSRIYFSKWMPKSRIAPFFGLGLGYTCNDLGSGGGTFEPVFTLGANWFMSKGSVDITLLYGTERDFSFNVGYTLTF